MENTAEASLLRSSNRSRSEGTPESQAFGMLDRRNVHGSRETSRPSLPRRNSMPADPGPAFAVFEDALETATRTVSVDPSGLKKKAEGWQGSWKPFLTKILLIGARCKLDVRKIWGRVDLKSIELDIREIQDICRNFVRNGFQVTVLYYTRLWMDVCMDAWMYGWMYGCMVYGCMDVLMYGMDVWWRLSPRLCRCCAAVNSAYALARVQRVVPLPEPSLASHGVTLRRNTW